MNQLQDTKQKLDQLEASVSAYKIVHNGELPLQAIALSGAAGDASSDARLWKTNCTTAYNVDSLADRMWRKELNVHDACLGGGSTPQNGL